MPLPHPLTSDSKQKDAYWNKSSTGWRWECWGFSGRCPRGKLIHDLLVSNLWKVPWPSRCDNIDLGDPVHLGHHQLHHCHHRALDVLHLIIKKIFWHFVIIYPDIYIYTWTASPSWHILWLKLTWPHLSHCLMAVLGHTPFLYRPAHPISYCWLYILYFTHTINHIPIASPFSSKAIICTYATGIEWEYQVLISWSRY